MAGREQQKDQETRRLKEPLETRDEAEKEQPGKEDLDALRRRNELQVMASLRSLQVDRREDLHPRRLTEKQAEKVLEPAPTGSWLLRYDENRRCLMVSVKDGADTIGHYRTTAESADDAWLRRKYGSGRYWVHRPTDAEQQASKE